VCRIPNIFQLGGETDLCVGPEVLRYFLESDEVAIGYIPVIFHVVGACSLG
jgi:hypothetical protein